MSSAPKDPGAPRFIPDVRHSVRSIPALLLLSSLGCATAPVQPLQEPASGSKSPPTARATSSDYAANVDVLALGYADGAFEVRSPAPLHVLSRGRHEAAIVNLALSKDARRLATVDAAGHVAVSTVADGTLEILADVELAPSAKSARQAAVGLAWDATGRRLALSSGKLVRVVDLEACTSSDAQLARDATALAFAPDGKQLVAAGSELYFLGLPALSVQRQLTTPKAANEAAALVTDVGFSADGRALGLATLSGVAFLDLATYRFDFAALPGMKPLGLRFAEDGRVAVFGRSAVYAGAPAPARIEAASHTTRGQVTGIEFRRDGSLLVIGDGVEEELSALFDPPPSSPSDDPR